LGNPKGFDAYFGVNLPIYSKGQPSQIHAGMKRQRKIYFPENDVLEEIKNIYLPYEYES
jgi:hypothetical protein